MEKILAIDDEGAILSCINEILSDLGYEVKVAHDGVRGIELFDKGYSFDVVITDINMPKMNGSAVARHIRKSDKSDTPIVAITGFVDDGLETELFDSILMKPFKLEDLTNIVKSFSAES
jgi:CheY-like chemotaxis protein